MTYHVTDHHLDEDANVYRLTLGEEQEVENPMLDDDGQPVLDDDGNPQTETITVFAPVADFAFAADDERWAGLSPEEVAAAQREEVKRALVERDKEAAAAEAARTERQQLPGSGEAL